MGAIFSSGTRPAIEMALKYVNEAIAKDKVVIFSKTYCPYCTLAKEVCVQMRISGITWTVQNRSFYVSNKQEYIPFSSFNSFIFFHSTLQQFNKLQQQYTAIELDSRDDAADIQTALGEVTGATTVSEVIHIFIITME